jgi:hypothetical protein
LTESSFGSVRDAHVLRVILAWFTHA